MNKTKIDWATMSWNPVTGCRHGCPYCYARRTATRFNAGLEDPTPLACGLHVLPEKIKATPYPYGFEATLHRYLPGPAAEHKGTADRVCLQHGGSVWALVPTSGSWRCWTPAARRTSPAPLFVPDEEPGPVSGSWTTGCRLALLPHESNFWYGSTVANMDAVGMYVMQGVNINSFGAWGPLLGPVDMAAAEGLLVGDPGRRNRQPTGQGDARPRVGGQHRGILRGNEIPVFFKDNLRKYFRISPASAFPGRCEPCRTLKRWKSAIPCRKSGGREAAKNLEDLGNARWPPASGHTTKTDGAQRTRTNLWRILCWPVWRSIMWRSSQRINAGSFRCPERTEVNMLAVLMSMKPEWWEKILTGDKVLEIRKTHPQSKNHADLEWPLTVLVYVSGTGAVQGQFLCPGYTETNFMPYLEKLSCVPLADLKEYAGGKCLSGWIVRSPEVRRAQPSGRVRPGPSAHVVAVR